MKIHGQKPPNKNIEIIPIPREDGDIIFKAQSVSSFDEFDKICIEPEPPVRSYPDGRKERDIKDEDYVKATIAYNQKRMAWLFIKSLSATPGLEWENVDFDDPETWENYEDELKEVLTQVEIAYLQQGILDANNLNEEKLHEARNRFLHSQQAQQES